MKLFSITILGIIFQICFTTSQKVIVPIEEDNSNSSDKDSTLETSLLETNNKEEEEPKNKDSLQEDNNQNIEATPAVVNGPYLPPKEEVPTKIPMTCISDYIEYCQTKFFDLEFQDGCHKCRCTKSNKDFCDKGPCQFYAHSFEHAATYCTEISNQNKKDYDLQVKKRTIEGKNNFKKLHIKSLTKGNYNKTKLNVTKNTIPTFLKNFNETKEPLILKPEKRFKTEVSKTEKPSVDKSRQINATEKVFDKVREKNKFLGNISGIIGIKNTISKNSTEVPELITKDKISDLENLPVFNKKNLIHNIIEKRKTINIPVEKINEKVKLAKSFKLKNIPAKKINEKVKLAKPSKLKNIPNFKKPKKKHSINRPLRKRGGKISDKVNPIQSSLEKLSEKKDLKKVIYLVAYNQLNVDRINEKMKKEPHKNKYTKIFIKRLKEIKASNRKFKLKILEIVKMNLKLSQSNYGPFHHTFDKMYLKKIAKKLTRLSEELHEMKGGVKMWRRLSKKYHYYNSSSKCSCSLKIFFVISFFTFITTLI